MNTYEFLKSDVFIQYYRSEVDIISIKLNDGGMNYDNSCTKPNI